MKTILRKDLYDKIWSETKSRTAKELGLPFQELTQICRVHNIPTPTSNYWIQLSLGKPVIKAPLPNPEQNTEISLATEKTLKNIKKADQPENTNEYSEILDQELVKTQEKEKYKKLKPKALAGKYAIDFQKPVDAWTENVSTVVKIFPVEATLKSRREIVLQSKVYYKHLNNGDYEWIRRPDNKIKKHLDINVEIRSLDRALCLFDSLIGIFEALGGKMKYEDRHTAVVLGDVEIPISITERKRRPIVSKDSDGYVNRYDYIATGLLRVNLNERWRTKTVEDTDYTKLEDKLGVIVNKAVALVKEELDWRERCRLEEIERKRKEEERRLEEERKRQLELRREEERQEVRDLFDTLRREVLVSFIDRVIEKAVSASDGANANPTLNTDLARLSSLKNLVDPQSSKPTDTLLTESDIIALVREFFAGSQPHKEETPRRYHL